MTLRLSELDILPADLDGLRFDSSSTLALEAAYQRFIEETDVGANVVRVLLDDPRVQSMDGLSVAKGVGSARVFRVEWLAAWFLWAVSEFGQPQAKTYLESFLDASQIRVTEALWIVGLEAKEVIPLSYGYRIVPLEQMPQSRQKDLYLRPTIHAHPTAAICCDIDVPKCAAHRTTPGNAQQRGGVALMDCIALLLNLVAESGCLPHSNYHYYSPETPTAFFGVSTGAEHVYDVLGTGSGEITRADAAPLDALIRAFVRAPDDERSRVLRVLSRLALGRRRQQIEDKVLELGIALEMALLDDNKGADQLALAFALRGAWLAGSTATARREAYDQLRDLYKWRSQVAHTGQLCNGSAAKIAAVGQEFPELSALAGTVVRKLLLDGRPEWPDLLLGATI